MPPMVGVPRLVWWLVGPSSRISWPYPLRVRIEIAQRVPSSVPTRPSAPASRIALIAHRPSASSAAPPPPGRRPALRVPLPAMLSQAPRRPRATRHERARGPAPGRRRTPPSPARSRRCALPRASAGPAPPPRRVGRCPSAATSRPSSSCSWRLASPSSRISPSTATVRRPGTPIGDVDERPDRGSHAVRVRVVGVVDDHHAVRAGRDGHPPLRLRGRAVQHIRDVVEPRARARAPRQPPPPRSSHGALRRSPA